VHRIGSGGFRGMCTVNAVADLWGVCTGTGYRQWDPLPNFGTGKARFLLQILFVDCPRQVLIRKDDKLPKMGRGQDGDPLLKLYCD